MSVNELFRWAIEKTAKARESKGSWKYSIMSNIQKNRVSHFPIQSQSYANTPPSPPKDLMDSELIGE